MAYTFRYQIKFPAVARTDGSGTVQHEIEALYASDGVNYSVVPGRSKSVCVPAAEIQAALAAGTNNQKVNAYKAALAANLNFQPEGILGWDQASLNALMLANDAAQAAADQFNTFVTVTLNKQFPVTFNL